MIHFLGITAIIGFALWLFISDMHTKYDNQKDDIAAYENWKRENHIKDL